MTARMNARTTPAAPLQQSRSGWLSRLTRLWSGAAIASITSPANDVATTQRVTEAAGSQSLDEPGYTRLTGDGLGRYNERDLSPMAQDRMQKLAEYLWQSNLLANRLVEIPLAYLLAEGVHLECAELGVHAFHLGEANIG